MISDCNHPSKEYINYISTDLSAETVRTQNDGQNSGMSHKKCSNANTIFSC